MGENIQTKITYLIVITLFVMTTGIGVCTGDIFYPGIKTSAEAQFVVTVSGTTVNFDWSAMVAANAYTMAVALSEADGNIDMSTLNFLDMGSRKTFSTSDLPSGMIFCAVIVADTDQGLVVSNTAEFMPFAGTVTFPMDGAVLMHVDDPGGVGTITVSGVEHVAEETMTISQISGDTGSGSFVLTVVDDKPATYTKDDLTMNFTYAADGSVVVQSLRNSLRSEENLSDCQQRVSNELDDLAVRYHADSQALDKIIKKFFRPLALSLQWTSKVELRNKILALGYIFQYALDGVREKFKEDRTTLETEYEACSSSDITTGSWSIVNNHKLGDFDWYTFKFWGSAIAGSVQVIENNTTYDSYYSVSGSQVSLGFTLVNASGSLTMEEYVGSFKDADTIQGTWRKKEPEDKEWVEGYWTGTRNN